jgi:hypothetical protein
MTSNHLNEGTGTEYIKWSNNSELQNQNEKKAVKAVRPYRGGTALETGLRAG